MSIPLYFYSAGTFNTKYTILSTTSVTAVTPVPVMYIDVTSITCTNVSAGAVTINVEVFDGTNSYKLTQLLSLAAAGTLPSTYTYELPLHVDSASLVRVTASAANSVHVVVNYVVPVGRQ